MLNECIFVGRLGQKPELKHSASGVAYAKTGLAVNKSRKIDGEWTTETTWVDLVFFQERAENAAKILDKGDLISATTEYCKESYVNDSGKKVYSHSFVVDDWSRYARSEGGGGSEPEEEEEEKFGSEIPF